MSAPRDRLNRCQDNATGLLANRAASIASSSTAFERVMSPSTQALVPATGLRDGMSCDSAVNRARRRPRSAWRRASR